MRAEKKDRAEADCRGEELARKGGETRRWKWRSRRSAKRKEREREKKKKRKRGFRQEGGTIEGVEKSTRRSYVKGLMR